MITDRMPAANYKKTKLDKIETCTSMSAMSQIKAPVNVIVKDEARVASAASQRQSALARVEAKPRRRATSSEG